MADALAGVFGEVVVQADAHIGVKLGVDIFEVLTYGSRADTAEVPDGISLKTRC